MSKTDVGEKKIFLCNVEKLYFIYFHFLFYRLMSQEYKISATARPLDDPLFVNVEISSKN